MKPFEILEAAFRDCSSKGRLALVPFLTAGVPDAGLTVDLACALHEAGAAAMELGIPFSDPIADGPVIQEASQRALASGVHVATVLEMAARIRARVPMPLVAMTYANPILSYGPEKFARDAVDSGVNGVILTDVPAEEMPSLWAALRAQGLGTVLLVTPLTEPARRARIAREASGFVYVVSRTGVTGKGEAASGLPQLLEALRLEAIAPIGVGFGIEEPRHVAAWRGRSDGVVVGSALVRRVLQAPKHEVVGTAVTFFRELAAAAG